MQRDPSCTKTKKWSSGPVKVNFHKNIKTMQNRKFKIDPLAPVSAIERHLMAKGYGRQITETSGSGSEDINSDTDEEGAESHAVSVFRFSCLNSLSVELELILIFSLLSRDSFVGNDWSNCQSTEKRYLQI